MLKNKSLRKSVLALLCLWTLSLSQSCKVDDRYSFDNIKNVNTDVTVFENGISVPLIQSTCKISVDSILSLTGIDTTAFGKYFTVGDDGQYYISHEENYSLTEEINGMNFSELVKLDPITVSRDFSYDLSAFDPKSLEINEQQCRYGESLPDISLDIDKIEPVEQSCQVIGNKTIKDAAKLAQDLGQSTVTLPSASLDLTSSNEAVIDAVTMSSHIKSLESITLKSGSKIKAEVSIPGAASLFTSGELKPDVTVDLKDVLTFSDGSTLLHIDGLVLSKDNAFAESRTYAVSSLNAAKISQDKTISANGTVIYTDLICPVDKASACSQDINLEVRISFVDFALESAYGQVEGISLDIDKPVENITYDLPDNVANLGTFTVTPKGSPKVEVNINYPEIEGVSLTSPKGLNITVPYFIDFSDIPSDFTYMDTGTSKNIILNTLKNTSYDLTIGSLTIDPEKVDGKYVLQGDYAVKGSVAIPDGRMDVAKLLGLSEKDIEVSITIPTMEIESVQMSELSVDIDESATVDFLKASDIPEMVKVINLVNLEGTETELDIELTNLPDLGGNGAYTAELTVTLPDFVKPSTVQINGKFYDGKLSKLIDIESFNFLGYYMDDLRRKDGKISGDVKISGKIKAENPSVKAESLSGSLGGKISLNSQIKIESVRAKVGYETEKTIEIPFFSLPEIFKDAELDIQKATLYAHINSNLAVPMSAKIDLNDGMYDLPDLQFPYTEDPTKKETLINEYHIDLNPLFETNKEVLPVKFNLSVSDDAYSVIYPDADHELDIDFGFQLPVQFGDKLNATYADTLKLGEDPTLITRLLKESTATLKGKVENTLPFKVNVIVEFLSYDSQSDKYTVIDTGEPITLSIAAADPESGKTEEKEDEEQDNFRDFETKLNIASDTDFEGLSHIRLSFTIGSNGEWLKKSNYIMFKNISLSVSNGITFNVNDLINGGSDEDDE